MLPSAAIGSTPCLAIVNESGQAFPLPGDAPGGWSVESSLDLEMISAGCPDCNIVLVEAKAKLDGVDHRATAVGHETLEQPKLGSKISLDARMIVEMIATKIGEATGGDAHAVEPVLVEAM